MSIATELPTRIDNNRRTIFITDADDLLAAWRFQRLSSPKRSKNLCAVPTRYRFSAPTSEKTRCMPCHVSFRRKAGRTYSEIKPDKTYSAISCHGHGRKKHISAPNLDTLEVIAYAKENFSPYVSPILDSHTLMLVCKDLGISARAIPKVIDNRQYIALVSHNGIRNIFPQTLYAVKNSKVISMAIGALGIKNMVKRGAFITLYVTVPLTILEAFLKDHATCYTLVGNIASDLIKIGIQSLMAAIIGLAVGEITTFVLAPIAFAIVAGIGTGYVLDYLDKRYKLTEKLIVVLEEMGKEADNMVYETERTIYQGFKGIIKTGSGFGSPYF